MTFINKPDDVRRSAKCPSNGDTSVPNTVHIATVEPLSIMISTIMIFFIDTLVSSLNVKMHEQPLVETHTKGDIALGFS